VPLIPLSPYIPRPGRPRSSWVERFLSSVISTLPTPKPIRTGIYRFVSQHSERGLKDVLSQTGGIGGRQLFKYSCSGVPSQTLQQR